MIAVIITWIVFGFYIFKEYEDSSGTYNYRCEPVFAYLNPVWLYRNYRVNYFGAFLLTLVFNLINPLVTVIYWPCVFIKWITTVGRK